MFDATIQIIGDRTHKYSFTCNGGVVTFKTVLNLWQYDQAFRSLFVSQLVDSPFSAYRWETPAITNSTVDRNFEFVLLNAPGLARSADRETYVDYFSRANKDGIVVFDNLGKDAVLVVPAPCDANSSYDQLASFIRSASEEKIHAFWSAVGEAVQSNLSDRPLWLSTAGGGVAWVHARLDSRPKYYGHTPYKNC